MTAGIYKIESKDGKVYIGSAVNVEHRFSVHKTSLNKNKHGNRFLQRAWNKYGETFFKFSIVEEIDNKENLIYYEQLWLDVIFNSLERKNIYNIRTVANSNLGLKWSEESKRKNSNSNKGRIFTKEHRSKISEANKKRVMTPETIEKIRFAAKNYRHTPEAKAKISEFQKKRIRSKESILKAALSNTGRKHTEESKNKMRLAKIGMKRSQASIEKQIIARSKDYGKFIDSDGNIFHIKGMSVFCKNKNLDPSCMIKVAKGKISSHKGWRKYHA